MAKKLFVGNLPYTTTDADLKEHVRNGRNR